jgi:cytidine deaminase
MTTETRKPADLDKTERDQLISTAIKAAENAYAPYSQFRVGAAVLGADGTIYSGANIENASYGLGTCAERVALATAYSAGQTDIKAIAIACIDADTTAPLSLKTPCGACRQWIQELAPQAHILIAGEPKSFRIQDLLPHAFTLNE